MRYIYLFYFITLKFWVLNSEFTSPYRDVQPLAKQADVIKEQDGSWKLPIVLRENGASERLNEVIKGGVPFAKGELFSVENLKLKNENENEIPCEFKVMSRWWDYRDPESKKASFSVKWLLVTFLTNIKANESKIVYLHHDVRKKRVKDKSIALNTRNKVVVDTKKLKAVFIKREGIGLKEIWVGKKQLLGQPLEIFSKLRYIKPPKEKFRSVVKDLSHKWKFNIDPKREGKKKGWHRASYDDSNWGTMDPAKFWDNNGYKNYRGRVWYRCRLRADETWLGNDFRLFLQDKDWGDGDIKITVYCNGTLIDTYTRRDASKKKLLEFELSLMDEFKFNQENLISIAYDSSGGFMGLLASPKIVRPYNSKYDEEGIDYSGVYNNYYSKNVKIDLIHNGSQNAVVEMKGWLANEFGEERGEYRLYFSFFKGSDRMDVSHTFLNTENEHSFRYESIGLNLYTHKAGKVESIWGGEDVHKYVLNAKEKVKMYQFHDGIHRYPGYPDMEANPLNLKYTIKNESKALFEGKRAAGWVALNSKNNTVFVGMKDFWKSYPSSISVENGKITAYMWPEEKEMDLRTWYYRKDGCWNDFSDKAKKRGPEFVRLRNMVPEKELNKFTKFGVRLGWTRHWRFIFNATEMQVKDFKREMVSLNNPVLPFVSPSYMCRTEAMGLPIHPFDSENYPRLERKQSFYLDRYIKSHDQWGEIYGMFHYGATRYRYQPGKMNEKYELRRRWLHHENGESPSMTLYMQYLRTGKMQYYSFAESRRNFSNDVITVSNHPILTKNGHVKKHSFEVFMGKSNGSHANFEGQLLGYFLSGDARTYGLLNELKEIHLERTIQNHAFNSAKPMDRNLDGPMMNMTLFWFWTGDRRCREWVEDAIRYYKDWDSKGFTSLGKMSYRIRNLARCWFYTRDERFYRLSRPRPYMEYFVYGKAKGLAEQYLDYISYPKGRFSEFPRDRDYEGEREIDYHGNTILGYPGLFQAAFVRAGIPRVDRSIEAHPQFLSSYFYGVGKKDKLFSEKGNYIPIDLKKIMNVNPLKESTKRQEVSQHGYHQSYNDGSVRIVEKLGVGVLGIDAGPMQMVQEGWVGVDQSMRFPCFEGFSMGKNFTGYPFGLRVKYANIPFDLVDPLSNQGKGILVINKDTKKKIKIGKKVKNLYVLGHIAMNKFEMDGLPGSVYKIFYADGKIETKENVGGLDYDYMGARTSSATRCINFDMLRECGRDEYLHVNLLPIKTNPNVAIDYLEIEGLKDDALAILGITVEGVHKKNERKAIAEWSIGDQTDNSDNSIYNTYVELELKNGFYRCELELNPLRGSERLGGNIAPQLFIEAQDKMVAGAYLVEHKKVSFPVEVRKGKLKVAIIANMLNKPNKKILKGLKLYPLDEKNKDIGKRIDLNQLACLGWNRGGGHMDMDYEEHSDVQRDFVSVYRKKLSLLLPNGDYEIEAYVFNIDRADFDYQILANQIKSDVVTLPRQSMSWPYSQCRSYELVKVKTKVKDEKLTIDFGIGKRPQNVYLRGLKIVPL